MSTLVGHFPIAEGAEARNGLVLEWPEKFRCFLLEVVLEKGLPRVEEDFGQLMVELAHPGADLGSRVLQVPVEEEVFAIGGTDPQLPLVVRTIDLRVHLLINKQNGYI